jgi:hypothetical protein
MVTPADGAVYAARSGNCQGVVAGAVRDSFAVTQWANDCVRHAPRSIVPRLVPRILICSYLASSNLRVNRCMTTRVSRVPMPTRRYSGNAD